MSVEANKRVVQQFVDAFNRQDQSVLPEIGTPAVAAEWSMRMPLIHANMNEYHIDITDMVAEGDLVAVRMVTHGYHSGELFGLPPTGAWWTNRMHCFVRFIDGKIADIDLLADVENHIKQIGGVIVAAKER